MLSIKQRISNHAICVHFPLLLFCWIAYHPSQVAAFAEAPTAVRRFGNTERQRPLRLLQPADCSFHALRGRAEAVLDVVVEIDLPPAESGLCEACVVLSVRSSTAKNWWFIHPPINLEDSEWRLCAATTPGTTVIRGQISLKKGFSKVAARFDHQPWPDLPLLEEASSFVEAAEQQSDQHELEEAFRVVRKAEAEEHEQRTAEYQGNALKYRSLALHPELLLQINTTAGQSSSALMQLEPVLDPSLFAALKNNSVGSLWQLLDLDTRASSSSQGIANGFLEHRSGLATMPTPLVATFPLLKLDAAEKLIEELQHAQGLDEEVLRLTIPNNAAEGRTRSRHSGVVLEEIGLGPLAEALTVAVLTPIAQLMYPALTGRIDSYHAFSIHVAALADNDEREETKEEAEGAGDGAVNREGQGSSRDFETLRTRDADAAAAGKSKAGARAEPVEHRTVGDQLPQHIDVCEVSMNICLGRSFAGSSVKFTQLNGADRHPTGAAFGAAASAASSPPAAADLDAQWVHHEPGVAFINLCQHHHGTDRLLEGERHSIVVRGLASQFRRAPAESFTQRCAMGVQMGAVAAAGGGKHTEL